jgi:transcriptional regulator with PAS, ATPase and Fis domain
MGLNQETVHPDFIWDEDFPSPVTVCDMEGIIIAMNRQARKNFKKWGGKELIGKSLYSCHSRRSGDIIRRLLGSGEKNVYVVQDKKGSRIVQQIPWYKGDTMAGLVEIITPFTGELAVKDRT